MQSYPTVEPAIDLTASSPLAFARQASGLLLGLAPVASRRCGTRETRARYRARSLWLDGIEGSLAPRPALPGDAEYDVAIVGGGFTGLWSAYYLKQHQPDLRVVVLEREIAGYGPSGRNGGWVSGGVAGSAAVYAKQRGADAVRRGGAGDLPDDRRRSAGWWRRRASSAASTTPARCSWRPASRSAAACSTACTAPTSAGSTPADVRLLAPAEVDERVRVAGCVGRQLLAACGPDRSRRGWCAAWPRRASASASSSTSAPRRWSWRPGHVRCAAGTVRAGVVLRATEAYTASCRARAAASCRCTR